MEQFSVKIDSYNSMGHSRGYLNFNEVPWLNYTNSTQTQASEMISSQYYASAINGRLTSMASSTSNSIHVMVVKHTTELYRSFNNSNYIVAGNSQAISYALIGINLSGMSNVSFPSADDDPELNYSNISDYKIRIFDSNGFRVYNTRYDSTLWIGGDTTGNIDFDINLDECAIQFIRSTTYGAGVVYPTSSKIVFSPQSWFNSNNFSECEFETGAMTYNRLVTNLNSAYGSLFVQSNATAFYKIMIKSNSSYNPIAIEDGICYAIPSPMLDSLIDSKSLGLTFTEASDYTDNNILINTIKENVDELLPKDYITR